MPLTPRQQAFVDAYLVDLNATQAAIRAGYSAKTAHAQGPRLLEHVEVRAAVNAALKRRSERVEVKSDDVLRELLRLATCDIGEAFDDNGRLKPIKDIPPDVRRAIAGIEVFEEFKGSGQDRIPVGEVRKVKFWDKTKGLELLGKHLKLFTEKVELTGKLTLAELVAAAAKSAPAVDDEEG